MPRTVVVLAAAFGAAFAAAAGHAQETGETEPPLTAERLLEVAREVYRPTSVPRPCRAGAPGEIVVCARADEERFRVTSPTEDAYRARVAPRDVIPRAPAMAEPPCDLRDDSCHRFGHVPRWPPMIDYDAIPVPLTDEEAARVFRAEEAPPEP